MSSLDSLIDEAVKTAAAVGQQRRDNAMKIHTDNAENQRRQIDIQQQNMAAQAEDRKAQNDLRSRQLDMQDRQHAATLESQSAQRKQQGEFQQLQALSSMLGALSPKTTYGGGTSGVQREPFKSEYNSPQAQLERLYTQLFPKVYDRIVGGIDKATSKDYQGDMKKAEQTAHDTTMGMIGRFTGGNLAGEAQEFGVSPSRVQSKTPAASASQSQQQSISPARQKMISQIEGLLAGHVDRITGQGQAKPPMNTSQKIDQGIRDGFIKPYPGTNPAPSFQEPPAMQLLPHVVGGNGGLGRTAPAPSPTPQLPGQRFDVDLLSGGRAPQQLNVPGPFDAMHARSAAATSAVGSSVAPQRSPAPSPQWGADADAIAGKVRGLEQGYASARDNVLSSGPFGVAGDIITGMKNSVRHGYAYGR